MGQAEAINGTLDEVICHSLVVVCSNQTQSLAVCGNLWQYVVMWSSVVWSSLWPSMASDNQQQ